MAGRSGKDKASDTARRVRRRSEDVFKELDEATKEDTTYAGRMGLDPRDPWYDEINRSAKAGVGSFRGAVARRDSAVSAEESARKAALQRAMKDRGGSLQPGATVGRSPKTNTRSRSQDEFDMMGRHQDLTTEAQQDSAIIADFSGRKGTIGRVPFSLDKSGTGTIGGREYRRGKKVAKPPKAHPSRQ